MLLPQKFQNSRMTEPKIPPVIKWKQNSRWAFQESFFSGDKVCINKILYYRLYDYQAYCKSFELRS